MKKLTFLLLAFLVIFLCSCSNIPDTTVFDPLSTDDLSKAMKSDTFFEHTYKIVRAIADDMDEIQHAKYKDVTYRSFHKLIKAVIDTAEMNPHEREWEQEWEKSYGSYQQRLDSLKDYWTQYKEENWEKKYVAIELVNIRKRYYYYIRALEDVSLSFKISPIEGAVDKVTFTYMLNNKHKTDSKYFIVGKCATSGRIGVPAVRSWDVGYSDKDVLEFETIESLRENYDISIDILSIEKDGQEITIDEVLPNEVVAFLGEYHDEDDEEALIQAQLNKEYLSKDNYVTKSRKTMLEKNYGLSYEFLRAAKL